VTTHKRLTLLALALHLVGGLLIVALIHQTMAP